MSGACPAWCQEDARDTDGTLIAHRARPVEVADFSVHGEVDSNGVAAIWTDGYSGPRTLSEARALAAVLTNLADTLGGTS